MTNTDPPTMTVEDAIARVDDVLAALRAIAPPAAPSALAAIGDVVSGELIESQWGNAVGDHIDELDRLIHRTPSGTPGQDLLTIEAPPNASIVNLPNAHRVEVRTSTGASPWGLLFGSPDSPKTGLYAGRYEQYNVWPIGMIAAYSDTGTGDPAHFMDTGGRSGTNRVRLRFQNIDVIEASVPWPVASSVDLKQAVEDVGEVPDIRTLRVVRYIRADDPAATERIGFIAEELGEALPEAAVVSDAGTSTAYLNEVVVAVLVATVQDLVARVEALETGAVGA